MDAPTWNRLAARSRQPGAPSDNDDDWEEWEAAMRRARAQAASPRALRPPPPPLQRRQTPSPFPRDEWSEMPATPPPLPVPQAQLLSMVRPKTPGAAITETVRAKLDAIDWGAMKRPAPRAAFVARRPGDQDLATPPPLANSRRAAGPRLGPAKRP